MLPLALVVRAARSDSEEVMMAAVREGPLADGSEVVVGLVVARAMASTAKMQHREQSPKR